MGKVQGFVVPMRHPAFRAGLVLLSLITIPASGRGAVEGLAAYRSFCKPRVAQYAADYDRICAAHPNSPAVAAVVGRISQIEKLAVAIASECSSRQTTAMDSILDDVLADDGYATPTPVAKDTNLTRQRIACDIYERFKSAMHAEIPRLATSKTDTAILQRYLLHSWEQAFEYVLQGLPTAYMLDSQSRRRVHELLLVIPLLRTPDSEWTIKHVESLPERLQKRSSSVACEEFVLSLGRPITALRFHQKSMPKNVSIQHACEYLKGKSAMLKGQQRYLPARDCLQAAMKIAADAKDVDVTFDLAISLSELYAEIGHPSMAAGFLQVALENYPAASAWGRGAVLRLKYLYTAGSNSIILADAPKYLAHPACAAYLPHIMYVHWVTLRREGKGDAASALQDEFLKKYADHPLAADMHFTRAMAALAGGEYDEAGQILDLVRYRFPKSTVAQKATSLHQRLENMEQ